MTEVLIVFSNLVVTLKIKKLAIILAHANVKKSTREKRVKRLYKEVETNYDLDQVKIR